MKLKPITARIVLSLVVASLLIAGCTTSTTSNTNKSPTPSTATHDAFLEKYLAEYENETLISRQVNLWNVTWVNSTSASLQLTYIERSTDRPVSSDQTITMFPTTQDATNYVDAMNKTKYSLSNVTDQTIEGTYRMAAGHAPQIYKDYVWNEGSSRHEVIQLDTVVNTITAKTGMAPSVAPTPIPTPTPKPTEVPTLSSFHGLLLEHPASAGGDDLSAKVNKEVASVEKIITPFHRATIDGRDVYIGTAEQDNGLVVKTYIFPLGSYDESRAAQKAYVTQFQGIGFTIESDKTTNSLEDSFITLHSSSETVSVQALGCNIALGCKDAMSIYIPIQGSRTS